MTLIYHYLCWVLWLSWGVYWWVASRDVKATMRSESLPSRLLHLAPLALAALLLAIPTHLMPTLDPGFWPTPSIWPFWVGAGITAAGLMFAVWARLHLGRNWSAMVTLKENHELVTSGPYGIVRHPIYTGLFAAFAGSAVTRGDWQGVLAMVIAFGALWRKLRLEERGMREQFGSGYVLYSQRVAALVPFIK